ncbi:transporter [Haloarchaeobius sp. TZWWS8]|uniref:transporter n=1 Tax=Haloarchaeobius sp. TZWWS8 TaxID=3446121 RepID=UPI003EBE03E0
MSIDSEHGSRPAAAAAIDGTTVARGAGTGALAFLVSYVLTALLWAVTELPRPESLGEAFEQAIVDAVRDSVPTWQSSGMVFFNGHFVDVRYEGQFVRGSVDLVSLAGGGLVQLVYVVVPLALVAAGFVAARRSGHTGDLSDAIVSGSLVAPGYLPQVVLGAVLFAHATDGSSLSIPLVEAVVVAGVVYPLICGGVGGLVAHLVE